MKCFAKNHSFIHAQIMLAVLALGGPAFAARAGESGLQPPTNLSPLGNLPLYFEANRGQTDAAFPFLARGRGCNFFVSPSQARLTLTKFDAPAETTRDQRANTPGGRLSVTGQLQFDFLGANRDARLTGGGELPGKANYFLGSDPARWSSAVSLFTQIRVEQIYPGVDLVYYGNHRRLEYDFVLAPKTDPAVIAIRFTGADRIRVDREGNLVFTLGRDEISQPKPIVYQVVRGQRKEIAGGYQLADPRTVTFKLGNYDRELPLVIDPILSYARFFGGNASDIGWDIALDKSGDGRFVYVAGETMSAGLPITTGTNYSGGNQFNGLQSGGDAFVAKFDLNSASANPVFLTYLGGKGDDAALAIAVDSDGNSYITGFTTSTNFPHPNGIFTNLHGLPAPGSGIYPTDAFIAKLYSTGTLAYATYLGGSTNDVGVGIALDSARNVYVTGYTGSKDFYTTNALYGTNAGSDDAFVAKLNTTGDAFLYSTYLGGTNVDHGEGIVADDAGYAYVTGYTASTNFPATTNAVQQFLNSKTNANAIGAYDAFITKLTPAGDQLAYSTYLGGARNDFGFRITLDAQTNIYVTGSALSVDFPVFPASNTNLQTGVSSLSLLDDVFVAKLNADGSQAYTVMFGGTNVDVGWDLAVDAAGQAHVVGETYSTNYPTLGAYELLRATNSGGADVFVSVLNSNGTAFVRSAMLGGALNDFGYGIELDAAGNDYIVGRTYSTNFPTVAPFTSTFGGTNDAFIAKIGVEPTLNIAPEGSEVRLSWQGYGFLLQANTNLMVTNGWLNVGGSADFTNGTFTGFIPTTREQLFFRLAR
jgi:hypothetical protein